MPFQTFVIFVVVTLFGLFTGYQTLYFFSAKMKSLVNINISKLKKNLQFQKVIAKKQLN